MSITPHRSTFASLRYMCITISYPIGLCCFTEFLFFLRSDDNTNEIIEIVGRSVRCFRVGAIVVGLQSGGVADPSKVLADNGR